MFISNNHASLHLWSKDNLLKHQKVLQYYFHDCLKKNLLLFMSLLTGPLVKNSHNEDGISFIFLKNVLK